MSARFRVAKTTERGAITFDYAADAESQRIIDLAGGRSKLSEFDKARVKLKTVGPGDDCSDMPESARSVYLERGWIEEVKGDDE